MAKTFDLVVLGGGPAGSSGAAGAGFLGRQAALVEKAGKIGGAGINTGTLPSKTLRETALVLSGWRSRRLFGVDLSLQREATVGDFMRHQKHVTAAERARTETRLASANKVTRFAGTGNFVDPHTVRVVGPAGDETLLRGERFSSPPAPRRCGLRTFLSTMTAFTTPTRFSSSRRCRGSSSSSAAA